MIFFIGVSLVLVPLIGTVETQFYCARVNGLETECVSVNDCPFAVAALKDRPIRADVARLLRRLHCGFEGFTPFICCSEKFDLDTMLPRPKLFNVTASTTDSPIAGVTHPVTPATKNPGDGSTLPPVSDCGYDYGMNKILTGEKTELDEFPWMVLLAYRYENGSSVFQCGGAIINKRYILTAAHCIKGKILRNIGPLSFVRVGEYDLRTDRDCINIAGEDDCAPPHQDIRPEEIIPHPGFTDAKTNREDDIGIIRLAKDLDFNFFVQPICLSSSPLSVDDGEGLYVSGWGRTLTARSSAVKLKLVVPKYDKIACDTMYAKASAFLTQKQLCAGGDTDKDTCTGDSGGPLMKIVDDRWYALGVVSFGNGCGRKGWPGIYTKVEDYMDWIKSNMKP